ncbi:MAG: flagellar hook-associated protein FlgK [Veillonellaceae bacterium]|uniref:flagellar hook-associated protein FlgK n=1 Tax=Selenomonas sp. TaxID=2053611 RepID=UPI0025E0B36C|nr:flagellar hook-associated protein FlgK [Selenomonas sp.]MCI6099229.1 flagellar hook-associated protein FlgK [Selenomonas sp.]MCI6232221.1 flagellar hook-associated protein FlgK [Selenomonas sp.]MCI7540280.1 flagellar hook-associated protein FlgK [Veillonellaceae bacterium]
MRSTFAGLNTMVRGIFSNQLSLDTTGHNITNASTEGYSRQSVNLAATRGQNVGSIYGEVIVGTGVDSTSILRARNVYADKQYWSETSQQKYFTTQQTNYDKVEAIFDDSKNTGLKNAITEFYNAWNDLSTNASTSSNRIAVIEKGNVVADRIKTTAQQLQSQITAQYDDMRLNVKSINDYCDQLTQLNQNIMQTEASGGTANDLRDQRDEIVDKLSEYMNLNIYEDDKGMYSVVSNGITLVNGNSHLTLEMSDPYANKEYGISDYSVNIKESGVVFLPTNGSMKAQFDTIAEDKGYIDKLANISATFLTTFNTMHQQGAGVDGTDSSFGNNPPASGTYAGPSYGLNFWGEEDSLYTWDATNNQVVASRMTNIQRSVTPMGSTTTQSQPKVTITGTASSTDNLKGINIINELGICTNLKSTGGQNLIAARKLVIEQDVSSTGALQNTYSVKVNGSGDGTNATNISTIINMDMTNVHSTSDIVYMSGTTTLMDTSNTTNPNNMTSRAIKDDSINAYYSAAVAKLGSDSESVDDKSDAQDKLITQIKNWRSSTSGVDWNEELSNMIMFQQGYSACSRCLTTMDEMLDKLINSTGMVGR